VKDSTQSDFGLKSEVLDFVHRTLGATASLSGIAGDASTRRFFRVSAKGGTSVLMVQEGPIGSDSGQLSNHRIFEEIGAPVPRLIAHQDDLGVVLFEDLGDLTLQRYAMPGGEGDPRGVQSLYLQACDLITLMQDRGTSALRPQDFASRHALDRERFLFELDHFDRHFIRGLRGKTPSSGQEKLLRHLYEDLAAACDVLPRTFCHRDFQSRNLLVRDGRLGLIDFQDARLGPYTYDAASLLRDSSLDLPSDLVEESLARLEATSGARLGMGREAFRRDFDLMALQRNIKDLGTFGYMATVRGRKEYLEYVPRTQASIRRTMVSDRRYHEIYGLFGSLVLD
jgi:aminoglycoside/choline kinase family phosphotransferase